MTSQKYKPKRAQILLKQEHYNSLNDEEKSSGRYGVVGPGNNEIIRGATRLAQKAGYLGGSLTPYVYEYLQLKSANTLEES
jgi:hypothetical protein